MGAADEDKNMVNVDDKTKILMNDIKAHLLKKSNDPHASVKTSYRSIVKMAIEDYHKKLVKND